MQEVSPIHMVSKQEQTPPPQETLAPTESALQEPEQDRVDPIHHTGPPKGSARRQSKSSKMSKRNAHLSILTPSSPSGSSTPSTPTSRNTIHESSQSNRSNASIMAQECVGLPVFISPDTGETITSERADSSSSGGRRESILSPKRLSMALDFAITSIDNLYKQGKEFLTEDMPPPQREPVTNDLESGGFRGKTEQRFGEDGYEDWLD